MDSTGRAISSAPFYIGDLRGHPFAVATLVLGTALPLAGTPALAGARPPTATRITIQLRAAVSASRSHVKALSVDLRTKTLRLNVSVPDPAAYLKHRYARVVDVVYPRLVSRFSFIYLKVFDGRSSRAVLTYSDVRDLAPGGTRQQGWHIASRLLDCARNLPLDDIEIDPDHAAPPCPAR